MDLQSLLTAYLIAQGAHTTGHFNQAMNQSDPMNDVPMKLDTKNLVENWQIPDNWQPATRNDPYANLHQSHESYLQDRNKTAANIHGAGFAMQDKIRNLIDDPETQKQVSGMSALIKGLYLAGAPMKLSQQIRSGGDIGGMEETSGNKHVKALLGASLVSDILKSQGMMKDKSLDFTTIDGAPGLIFNMKF